jgi:NADPH:quinone reductase
MTELTRAAVLREGVIAPAPEPREIVATDGEILLDLLAADVQPLDRQIAAGALPGSGPLPMVAGVSAVAQREGQSVVVLGELTGKGITRDGCFADRFTAAPHQLVVAPDSLDPAVIAAGALLGLHARHVLFEVARAVPGERVLVLGATGGFGAATMQIAVASGLVVVAAARRPEAIPPIEGVHAIGLDDLAAHVKELTDGGVDIVIDPLGGDILPAAVRSARPGARHLLLGHTAGRDATLPVPAMMLNEHRIIGVNGFLISESDQRRLLAQSFDDLVTGRHVPRIRASFDLADVEAAYAEPAIDGRVLLTGSAGHVPPSGSAGRIPSSGSAGRIPSSGSAGHVPPSGSAGHVPPSGSAG